MGLQGVDRNNSEFDAIAQVSVLSNLVGDKDLIMGVHFLNGNTVVNSFTTYMEAESVSGDYANFYQQSGSVYFENSDKITVSFGIGKNNTIETYLAEYEINLVY